MGLAAGKKALRWLKKAEKVIWDVPLSVQRGMMIGLSLFMSFLVVAEVVIRYVVFTPQLWVEELTLYVVFWFYWAGGAYATYKHSHIVGGIVHMIFKNRPKVLGSFEILAAAIPLALTILMIHLSYRQFVYSLEVNPRTIHLFLPLVYARLSLLVGFVFMALYFARELVAAIRGLIQGVPVKVILGSEQ